MREPHEMPAASGRSDPTIDPAWFDAYESLDRTIGVMRDLIRDLEKEREELRRFDGAPDLDHDIRELATQIVEIL